MHTLEQTIGVVGPVVGAIIVLTLFFNFLGWVGLRTASGTTRIAVRGVFDGNTSTTIHLSNGETLEDIRILGFTKPPSVKAGFPYELSGMVILQHPDGRHTIIRAKMIRKIEVPPGK